MSLLLLTIPHATHASAKAIAERALSLGAASVSIKPPAGRFILFRLFLESFSGQKTLEITAPRAKADAIARSVTAMAPGAELHIEEAELWVPLTLVAQPEKT
jgi:hypothetical protein